MKRIYKYLAALTVIVVMAGCTKKFEQLNTDPTKAGPESFNPNFLLTTSQLRYTGSADFSYETWRAQLIHFSTMIQHFSHLAGYWVGDKYTLNPDYNAAYFQRAYDEQVKHVVDLVELTRDKAQYANLHQIGRIMKVLIFHRITDIYGDVPYSEAGMGFYKRIFKPKYDEQSFIYADMLKELDEAAAKLDASKDKPTGDLLYNGDIAKWKRFAYSLMLRLGMRLTKVDANAAKTWAEKAAAGGTFTSNADNAMVKHDASGGRPTINRISQVLNLPYEIPYIRWSKAFIDFLKNNNDPRLGVLAEIPPPTPNENTLGAAGDQTPANQLGMPNGYDLQGGPTDISKAPGYPGTWYKYSRPINRFYAKDNGITMLLTYAETELLLAEADHRGWNIPLTAAEHYNNGVKAAMTMLAQWDAAAVVTDAQATAYLIAHPFVPANALEMINTQYWVATVFNDYEAFANWRRTAFPVLVPVNYPGNVTGGTIPRRLIYPQGEASTNPDNYAAAIGRIPGGDKLTSRVWWDKP
ncbi:MAG TPA: SusD/RagB family nutrient-binding outer membrane lipoprotein [Chitinophagaceae bacterium]|nr:SusD/RagB family nutrient-binding outer membrane lipoprotein [Chitinophagaceae bacterium]